MLDYEGRNGLTIDFSLCHSGMQLVTEKMICSPYLYLYHLPSMQECANKCEVQLNEYNGTFGFGRSGTAFCEAGGCRCYCGRSDCVMRGHSALNIYRVTKGEKICI